jgi:hypothetical protein
VREVLTLRGELKQLQLDYALRRFEEKFREDQPRDDRGRWVDDPDKEVADDAGKVGSEGSAVVSDESPDPIRAGAQYAQTRIEIHPSALTGKSRIDEATRALTERLAATVDALPPGSGPIYGRLVHEDLKMQLRFGAVPGIAVGDVEPTFGGAGTYGSKGSVRPDIVLRDDGGDIVAIYDFKTGNAEITIERAARLRAAAGVGPTVPVIELQVKHGVTLKSLWA